MGERELGGKPVKKKEPHCNPKEARRVGDVS